MYDLVEHVKKQNVATRLKLRVEQDLPKGTTFEQYYRANFFDAGRLLIHRLRQPDELQVSLAIFDQPDATFDAWKCDCTRFPHFTAFVGFWIYSFYDAEKNQNSRLDRNWQGVLPAPRQPGRCAARQPTKLSGAHRLQGSRTQVRHDGF
jgi:hypothetical protein